MINLLLVPLVGLAAYYAIASAYRYTRCSKWMNTAWAMAAGLLLAGCALYLIAKAANV